MTPGYEEVKRAWINPLERPLHVGYCAHPDKCHLYAELINGRLVIWCAGGHGGDAVAWRFITMRPTLVSIKGTGGRTRKKDLESIMMTILDDLKSQKEEDDDDAIIIRRPRKLSIKGLLGFLVILAAGLSAGRRIYNRTLDPFEPEPRDEPVTLLTDERPLEMAAAQNAVDVMCMGKDLSRDHQGHLHC